MIDVLIWIRKTGMVLCCLLGSGMLNAQVNHPEGGFVYDDAGVPRIDISMAQADLDMLYADPWSDVEYKAQFRFTREGVQEDVPDVGIRVRGNTSRNKEKKSFRISFNTFAGGAKFHGIEEMNLNAETNDPSMVRSKLSWNLFRFLGIPAVRSNHVLLYINDDFYGVYINTEHIDENFMKTRFGTNDGNLYKCLWPADLEYLGSDPDDYIIEGDRRRVYELKTNAAWDDYAD
ncbi:MAG: CotH kinase family protein, partial [Bacteroidales bacterium]|nr:CotH kinase family protein [Bacteroidales bacterium]